MKKTLKKTKKQSGGQRQNNKTNNKTNEGGVKAIKFGNRKGPTHIVVTGEDWSNNGLTTNSQPKTKPDSEPVEQNSTGYGYSHLESSDNCVYANKQPKNEIIDGKEVRYIPDLSCTKRAKNDDKESIGSNGVCWCPTDDLIGDFSA